MKNTLLFFIVICAALTLSGCAGTRFTEMLWAVGTEEDYLRVPTDERLVLYQADDYYYLECKKYTYQYRPGCFRVMASPFIYSPSYYQLLQTSSQPYWVKFTAAAINSHTRTESIHPQHALLQKGVVVTTLPKNAKPSKRTVRIDTSDNLGTVLYLGVADHMDGLLVDERKSGASYFLLPLMLPSLCIDISTYFVWPINFALGVIAAKADIEEREAEAK
ncbi:MAG: hypothetical protein IJW23_04515 [Lentisphaeria bacterium]|nr:hypothetical protein [Lentisphaeria bacterium]